MRPVWIILTGRARPRVSSIRIARQLRLAGGPLVATDATIAVKQVSATAGTIFHKTRTPLTVWFEVIWLVTASKMGVSAAHLHRVLPISSYQTAWTMMSNLRQVMSAKDSEPLSGQVEIDETFFAGPRPGVRGRGAAGKTLVVGAIEVGPGGWGRVRLAVLEDVSSVSLMAFISENIAAGSTVITDAWRSYPLSLKGICPCASQCFSIWFASS